MANALKQYDNNKFDLSYYKALAWGGLERTSSYTNLPLNEKQNIVSKTAALLLNRSKNNCDDL